MFDSFPKARFFTNRLVTPIYFETINLNAVEVRVIKIFQDNILQHLQQNSLGSGYASDIKRVGRRVAFKVISLKDTKANQWVAHGLDLSELITPDPGALYRIELRFTKDHINYSCENEPSYDDEANDEYYYEEEYYDEEVITGNSREEEEEREREFWDNQRYQWRQTTYNWRQEDNPCHPAYYTENREAHTHLLGSNLGLIIRKETTTPIMLLLRI